MEVKKVKSSSSCGCDQSDYNQAIIKQEKKAKSAVELNAKDYRDDQSDIAKRKRNRF